MKKLLSIILLLLTANIGQAQFNDSEPMFGQLPNLGHWSTDGLVFYWRGIPAGNVVDESLYRNHGTITGATWVGDGLSFDSATEYVTDINPLGLSVNELTAIVWVMRPALTVGDFYAKGVYFGDGFGMRADVGSTYRLAVGSQYFVSGAGGFNALEKTMFVISYKKDVWGIVYKNGVFAGNLSANTAAITHVYPITIGNNRYLNAGLVCTVYSASYYNRALSANEIQQLYINPDLPMQQYPIWLLKAPAVPPSGIVPIIQAHTRRRRAG